MKPTRRDFRLDIIVLLGSITGVTIAVFGVYRWLSGQHAIAWLDFLIVAGVMLPVLYAWRTGDSTRAGVVLCVLNSAGTLAACLLAGHTALTWIYLVLLTNFFIANRWLAVSANLAILVGVQLLPGFFHDGFHATSVAVSVLLITGFSYIFAKRTQGDRARLEKLAAIDALTGVPNRRSMERALADAVNRFQRGECGFGLVVLDLDHFKGVNDQYGHAAGDAAIADLASILRFEMRRNDQVFRFGGEEFVALLELDNIEDLETTTERLRKAVRASLRGPGGRITISLGAALLREHEKTWHDWFSRADAALYRAKSAGRDSYVIADDLF
ncbi:MAG TPA: GGDEF domain-containing protein [Pseudoxanthomonas sp.]|uniref:GGDEF domain-containing protein n=1 Tax=Pseudoxanthomonas sp. SE1 TaxID=1664560 RepID=UPI00240E74E4|nr:GGDEF domain-containing protein [Pseudoxanthomonas sp. SE1]WFC40429.1 GGDEF domain-containing protein [Pseudoxanthomonas sp. SE1]HJS36273.1 GGDEF domain-containing protein [Pseudoxanthomonas sp.]